MYHIQFSITLVVFFPNLFSKPTASESQCFCKSCHIYCCCLRLIISSKPTGTTCGTPRISCRRPCCMTRVSTQRRQRGGAPKRGVRVEPTASQAPSRQSRASLKDGAAESDLPVYEEKKEMEWRAHCICISLCFPHTIAFHVVASCFLLASDLCRMLSLCVPTLKRSLLHALCGYVWCSVSLLEPTALQ